jgi:predicted RNA binding protein YcfA (HicA-like mRNA interferase family)
MIHIMKSADLIRELKAAGWTLDRIRGSHHIFRRPDRAGHVTAPHPKKELGKGLVAAIREQGGLEG